MNGKKSFILYVDWIGMVNTLPDEMAGKLFKHIFAYVNDMNPVLDDLTINVAFEPIKAALKRDLIKWKDLKIKRSDAGKESANKRQHMSTHVNTNEQVSTNSTVSAIVIDSVSVSDNTKYTFADFWNLYDKKMGDKVKCEKKWNKLPDTDKERIFKTLPSFKARITEKNFQPYPYTYLNQGRWNDEIKSEEDNFEPPDGEVDILKRWNELSNKK